MEKTIRITEDYVSCEIAKLLNTKGFRGDFHKHYWGYESGKEFLTDGSFNPEYDYPAPTLSIAVKWLREIHNLHIEVYRTACGYLYIISKIPTGSDIYDNGLAYDGDDEDSGQWSTYEKCVEAAIEYCLENLI